MGVDGQQNKPIIEGNLDHQFGKPRASPIELERLIMRSERFDFPNTKGERL